MGILGNWAATEAASTLAGLRRRLQPGTVVLEYFQAGDELVLFVFDNRHLAAAGREDLAFGKFVQSGYGELHYHDHQDCSGHLKKLFEIDPDGPAYEADAEKDREPNAENAAD